MDMFVFCISLVMSLVTCMFICICKYFGIERLASICEIYYNLKSAKGRSTLSILFQVDEKSTLNGGHLVAATLKAHGVEEIFTLCGGHISPILVAAENLGIKIFDTRHEATAVFAADAVTRLRQSTGVAAVTAGPGVTNAVTALKNAQMAESPVLLIGGAAPTMLKNRGALQDIDQLSLFKPICKLATRVERLRDIVPTIRNAIRVAHSGVPGPVFIEFPIDVLYPYNIIEKELKLSKNMDGFMQSVINFYVYSHVYRTFGDATRRQDLRPLRPTITFPTANSILYLTKLLSSAVKPLMLIGSQATLPPIKAEQLRVAVQRLGIPVYLGGMSRGLLGQTSPILMRHCRKEALNEADVVILAGAICDFRLSYGRALPRNAKIIAINRGKKMLKLNEGTFWKATTLIEADVASALVELSESMSQMDFQGAPSDWIDTLQERDAIREAEIHKKALATPNDGNLNPLSLLIKLDQVIPEDTILVADGGDFVASAAYILRARGPLQWLDPGPFGTLGVGGGFALGAKVVHPESTVIILYGDGSSGYSLIEVDTFVRHKLPITAIIGNDACWTQIAREQIPMFKSSVAVNLEHSHYDKIGSALGAHGELITSKDNDRLSVLLKKAIAINYGGRSVVVNAIIGKTNFRDGSISV